MLRKSLAAAIVAASFAVSPAFADDAKVTIEGPWSRATAPSQPSGGAFLTIHNHGDVMDRLISAASPAAETVDIHHTVNDDGVMRMQHVDAIEIPADGMVTLAPGGFHIMLIGLKAPLKKGETLPITLTFEHAGEIAIAAEIQAAGAQGHAKGAHEHNKKK